VINNPRFEDELAAIKANPRDADQVLHAITWALARQPGRGFPIPGTSYSIWPVYVGDKEYVVYYRFSDTSVELLSIRPSTADGL
jgi:hypothetical protein